MKLTFQVAKEYNDHIDYVAEVDKDKSFHLVLPKEVLQPSNNRVYPYYIVAYCHTSSSDKSKHLCHKCKELYPAHQYAKHAKEKHT